MKLLSFFPNKNNMEHFSNSWEDVTSYIEDLGLDGIETMIGTYHPTSYLEGAPVRGLHLMYFPTWLDFWREDQEALIANFGSSQRIERYYGGVGRQVLIDHYKKEFENAKELGVEYMVFHVSHVNPRDIFTFTHDYTSLEVIDAAVELINEVFTGSGPALLLENLFWPGLDLRSNEDTRYLLDSINYENKGLLLDTSHLICTNKDIATFDEGADYILAKLSSMGELTQHIRGIHLNASTPHHYLKEDHSHKLKRWEEADSLDQFHIEGEHIKNIDTHSVFESHKVKEILGRVPWEYLTLELASENIEDLTESIKKQLLFLEEL